MKEIYKNPILYYVLVPAVVALWPLLVWAVYLPRAEEAWKDEKLIYSNSQVTISEILKLVPERLEDADPNKAPVQFDYDTAVFKAASQCKIPPAGCKTNIKPIRPKSGQKTQAATVTLKDTDITKFAEFLSALQLRWASLDCESITLTSKKGLPDKWDVDLDFKYYY
jgi:hypothetical protein